MNNKTEKGAIMGKMGLFSVLMTVVFLMAACASQEEENPSAEDIPFLEVNLTVNPDKVEIAEKVLFEAAVSFGGKPVENADKVNFEIWRSKSENHEKIEIEHAEDGIYRLEKSFDEEGTYYIYAHVTAEGMHNMPKKGFTIGTPSEPEDEKEHHEMEEKMTEEDMHEGH